MFQNLDNICFLAACSKLMEEFRIKLVSKIFRTIKYVISWDKRIQDDTAKSMEIEFSYVGPK